MKTHKTGLFVSLSLIGASGFAWFGSACGGTAEKDPPSGSGATSGANAAGSPGSGGGVSTGGSVSKGGSGGGTLAPDCLLPRDSGPCEAAIRAYYHDAKTGVCEPFIYGGCQGNANRFNTEVECQAKCAGGTPDMDRCDGPGDCVIASPGCCGSCGAEGREALVAINEQHRNDYRTAVGCDGTTCGACPPIDELQRQAQYFTASCENRQCRVIDIRETALTDCTKPDDCMLRNGSGCCAGCSAEGWVAVNKSADFKAYCGSDVACPKCASQPPVGLIATCASNKCKVVSGK